MADPQAQQAPAATPPPEIDLSAGFVPKPASQAPPQDIDLSAGFQPKPKGSPAIALTPAPSQEAMPEPISPIHKGLEQGVADAFGLKPPNPSDPHSLTLGDMVKQTYSNLKQGAIHSFENMGGHQEDLELPEGTGLISGPMPKLKGRSALALIGTPVDMLASGIEGMASTLEEGSKQIYAGVKAGDHEAAARGFGKVLGSLGQIAMGMEGKAVNNMVGKAGEVVEKNASVPGNSLLRATSQKNFLYGKDPGRVFIDEPIKPTLSLDNLKEQLDTAGQNLSKQVRSVLQDPKVAAQKIRADQIIDGAITNSLNDLTKQSGLRNRQAVIDAIHTLRNDMINRYDSSGKMVGSIRNMDLTPAEVSEIKTSVGKSTKWDQIPGSVDPEIQSFVNNTRKSVYAQLNNAIESAAQKGTQGTSVKALNSRLSNVIEAQGLLDKRLAQEGSNELGLRRLIAHGEWASGIGLLLSGNILPGSAMLADRAIRSTPGRIIRAKGGAALGEGMQESAAQGTPGTAAQAATITANQKGGQPQD